MNVCDLCGAGSTTLPWVVDNKTRAVCMMCRAKHPESDVSDDSGMEIRGLAAGLMRERDALAAECERLRGLLVQAVDLGRRACTEALHITHNGAWRVSAARLSEILRDSTLQRRAGGVVSEKCAVIGCDNPADPRWYAHDRALGVVGICDGHEGTPCRGVSCTCPPVRPAPPRPDVTDWAARYNIAAAELSTLRKELEEARGERDKWERSTMLLRDENGRTQEGSNEYHQRWLSALTERDDARALIATATARAEAAEKEIDQLRNRPHLDLCSCASTALGGYGCICIAKMALDQAAAKERERIAAWLDGTKARTSTKIARQIRDGAYCEDARLVWIGSICGTVSAHENQPDEYPEGFEEPCVLCKSPVQKPCMATVRRRSTDMRHHADEAGEK